jgi:hypothetical protein
MKLLIALYLLGYGIAIKHLFLFWVKEFKGKYDDELDGIDTAFICVLTFFFAFVWPIIGIGYLAYQYFLKGLVARINGGKN